METPTREEEIKRLMESSVSTDYVYVKETIHRLFDIIEGLQEEVNTLKVEECEFLYCVFDGKKHHHFKTEEEKREFLNSLMSDND